MDSSRSLSDAEICPNAVVKLEPVEFVLCDGSEDIKRDFRCQVDETYEDSKQHREIKEESEWENDVIAVGEVSWVLSSPPSENETNDQNPFPETKSEEDPEASNSLEREVTVNRDQGEARTDRYSETLSCSPLNEKDSFINNKEINLGRRQTATSAFFKEVRTLKNSVDIQSEIIKDPKTVNCLSRLSSSASKGSGGVPVLLLTPDNLREYSAYDTIWNKQLIEYIDERSLSSCSSASLGYDSGSEDLSCQEQSTNFYGPKCNKGFRNKASYNHHSQAGETKCDHCNRSFSSRKKLKMHKENLLKCHEFIRSGKLFGDRVSSGLNENSQADDNSRKSSLRLVPAHKLMSVEDNRAVIDERLAGDNEDSCTGGFTSGVGAKSIEENFEPENSTVCCKICRTVFTNKNNLKIHFVTHTERKNCKCNHCGKYFKSEKELYTHTENLLMGHTFLKSGQVSYVSFYGEPFYQQEVDCAQETIDEADIKPIIVLDKEGDLVAPISSPNNS